MKACVVMVVLFAAAAVVFCAEGDDSFEPSVEPSHIIDKRDTIYVEPPFPACVFWECISNCKDRGYRRGGYCTINGCQCLR